MTRITKPEPLLFRFLKWNFSAIPYYASLLTYAGSIIISGYFILSAFQNIGS